MARFLRQSTVATVKLGPLVSPSDGLTPFTAGGFAIKVGADGAALAARHDATAIAHDADGYYAVELDATDTATAGRLKVEVPGSANYLPAWEDFDVLPAAVFDGLFGATAGLPSIVADKSGFGLSPSERSLLASAVMSDVSDAVGADVAAIKAKTDLLAFAGGSVVAALGAAGLDLVVVEAGINARQALALIGAATAGRVAGMDTGTATFYAMGSADASTPRIVASGLGTAGNRPTIALTVPA